MSSPLRRRFLRGLQSAALALPLAALPLAAMAYPATTGMPIVKRPQFTVLSHIPLPGPARWDYAAFEPDTNHLFITQGTQLDVVNAAAYRKIHTIKGLQGIHGVAFAPKLDQGYISDGKAGAVRIFDLDTFKLTGSVKVGQDPDAIAYDPSSGLLFTANGGSRTLSVIRPEMGRTGKVVATIPLHADPEFLAADQKGHVFLNLNSADKIAVIDTRSLKISREIDVAPVCHGPTGLAIDRKRGRLFVSCRNGVLDVVDAGSGKSIAHLPLTGFSDAVRYSPTLNLVFAPSIDGKLTVIGPEQLNGKGYKILQTLGTAPGARTIAIDQRGPYLFLPTAKVTGTTQAAGSGHHGRLSFAPGSFEVIVVGPKGIAG